VLGDVNKTSVREVVDNNKKWEEILNEFEKHKEKVTEQCKKCIVEIYCTKKENVNLDGNIHLYNDMSECDFFCDDIFTGDPFFSFGGDKKTADDFYYKCGSVFANAKHIQFTNDQYNKYELALKSAQTLKKTLDDCDFGKAKLDEAEAKDAALWTEEAQAIQDEIDALQDQLDKLTPTVQNAKDLQATILGFAIKANLAFLDDKGTPDEDDDELVFNEVKFAGKDPLDPTKLSDKDFKDAYDFTVNLYNENIKDAEDDAAALKKLLDAFDTKGKEGNVIDFDNGCADLEEFFGTDEWAKMIKKVTDAQDEYEEAQNRTKKAQDAYDLLKSVYIVEQ
jgi:DNA repair exonuclease SbcCD ATPase subunit